MPFGYAPESAANLEWQNLPLVNSGFVAVGICLTGIEFLIANLGERFFYEVDFTRAPIVFYVGLLLAAGLVYLPLRWLIPRLAPSRYLLVTLILIGLLARVLLFGSNPILEIDYYRYLWDGAVLANGFSPYALPPAEVPASDLSMLAIQAGAVFERINYRELSSIYPPLAQALFALAYWLDAWQLDGLRLLLLIADLSTLYLILNILRRLNYSPYWVCLYWWNPLLVNLLSMGSTSPGLHARILVAVVVTLLVLYLLRKPVCDSTILIRQITITIAVLFLLSPVQLPWYCLWLLPFLCFYPHPALLLLTTLMPIYFLRFYFDFRGQVEIFDQWIVWCQYLPPLLLIITRGRFRLTFANQVPRHV